MRFDEANAVQRGMRLLAVARPMAWLLARVLHHLDRPALRLSRGRHCVTSALTGLPIVELTAVGARSREPRTLPIIGVPDGDRLVLIASNYGQHRNPGWYHNLKANPRCSVVFRGQRYEMEAYEAQGQERQRLWERGCLGLPAAQPVRTASGGPAHPGDGPTAGAMIVRQPAR